MSTEPIEIYIRPEKFTRYGKTFSAFLDGELLATHRDPEWAACRALIRRGKVGQVTFRWEGRTFIAQRHMIERVALRDPKPWEPNNG